MPSCRVIAPLILAECDGPLAAAALARLEAHVATCPTCRQQRAALRLAGDELRRAPQPGITADDARNAWLDLRPQLREVPARPPRAWIRPVFAWTAPLATAAVFAFALTATRPAMNRTTPPNARADFVQAPADASTLVYVDQQSGWLIVWASEPDPGAG